MKKLTLFKGKAMACLILMCLFLVQGCRKDLLQPNKNDLHGGISFAEAKAYFNANMIQSNKREKLMTTSISHSVTIADIMNNKKPIWEKAYAKLVSTGKAVKIPLDFGQTVAVIGSKKHILPYSSLNYLFMYKDSLEKIHAEWVELRPDSLWLYGNRTNYTGRIIVKDWSGALIKKMDYGLHPNPIASSIKSKTVSSLKPLPKVADQSTSFTNEKCIRIRIDNQCTCPDKYNCDYCLDDCAVELCWDEPICVNCDDGPAGGGNNGNKNNGEQGQGSSTGGSPNPGNYTPEDCTNGEQVVYPDGSMTRPPCIEQPIEDGGQTPNPSTLTAPHFLINNLTLANYEINFVNNPANSAAVGEIAKFLITNGLTGNKEFGQWAVGYLVANPNGFDQSFKDFLNGDDATIPEEEDDINSSLNLDIPSNLSSLFVYNGFNIFEGNVAQPEKYPETHPVSVAIANYNEWIYRALANANNTSVKHMHMFAKRLAGPDTYPKGVGAMGEAIFAKRVTTEYPVSPGGNMYIGYTIATTHIDALQAVFLPKVNGTGYGLSVNYTDFNGNPLQKEMKYPDSYHNVNFEIGRIAYEVKTNSASRNSVSTLYQVFLKGIAQTVHRGNISGVDVAILVMDYDAWKKLFNSSYQSQVIAKLDEVYNIKNNKNEQKIFLRIEKNLWSEANKSFWAIRDLIKNL